MKKIKTKTNNKRIDWVDWLKGFAILLVVIGHFPISYEFKKYLYSFHLPLFFILSGFTFNPQKVKTVKEFIIYKSKAILLPYLCLNISYFVFWSIFNKVLGSSDISLFVIIKGIIFGNNDKHFLLNGPTWFLPTLFLVELSAFVIIKFFGNDKKELLKISFGALIFGYIENVAKRNFSIIWHINSVPVALFLFFAGYILMQYYKDNKKLKSQIENPNILFGIISLVLGYYFTKTNGRVSFGGNHYHSMIYTLFAILFNCVGYYVLIVKLTKLKIVNNLLRGFGKNTLFILGFHKSVLILINFFFPTLLSRTIISIFFGSITVLILYGFSLLINKFCPFVIGKLEKSKSNLICGIAYCVTALFIVFSYYL